MSEAYGPAWVYVELMVHRITGEIHGVGGEYAPGDPESDLPLVGFELLRARLAEVERERDELQAECARLREFKAEVRAALIGFREDSWREEGRPICAWNDFVDAIEELFAPERPGR